MTNKQKQIEEVVEDILHSGFNFGEEKDLDSVAKWHLSKLESLQSKYKKLKDAAMNFNDLYQNSGGWRDGDLSGTTWNLSNKESHKLEQAQRNLEKALSDLKKGKEDQMGNDAELHRSMEE